jgi:hypothetical protein
MTDTEHSGGGSQGVPPGPAKFERITPRTSVTGANGPGPLTDTEHELDVVTDSERMFGTTGWCGTVNGLPALITKWRMGVALWTFVDGKWCRQKFDSVSALWKELGTTEIV